jgi:Glycosyl transferase family 2
MLELPALLIGTAAVVLVATWVVYPAWLLARARARPGPRRYDAHTRWPSVTIVVVVRNAEWWLRDLLQNLLALAYPPELRRILIVSNASSDFTDAVVASLPPSGVEVLRVLRARRSVAAAENLARRHVDSELVVVAHPAARLRPSALAALVAPFADPTVGVAYGREVPADPATGRVAARERPYRRFERWMRDAETRVFGTVSARRALYAVRADLYRAPVAATLSPDFAPILTAREHGYRAVYADDAECVMAESRSLRYNYGRMVRTATRDMATLLLKPHLLNPFRYGVFAAILLGHKLGRWLSSWALLALLAGLALLAPQRPWAAVVLALALLPSLAAALAWLAPGRAGRAAPAPFPLRLAATTVAMAHACVNAVRTAPEPRLVPVPPAWAHVHL